MWDVFISHASEDKEDLVRPLAEELVKYGVEVWYDEFTLELGDSLTKSIDRGLLDSKFGLIIISPAFFQKRWTDYELRSLLTKELNGGKTIIPIWHNVDQQFVASKSLFLADLKAITSDAGIKKLAYEVVRIVRPDIINSYLIKKACREMVGGEVKNVALKDLKVIEGVRHESLPKHLVIASELISTLFPIGGLKEVVMNFAKDADYDEEFVLWIIISCAYIDAMNTFRVEMCDETTRRNVYSYLLWLSLDDDEHCEAVMLEDEMKQFLLQAYFNHAKVLFPIIRKQ